MLRTRFIPDCGNYFFVNYSSRMYYQSPTSSTCPTLTECLTWGFLSYEPNPNPSNVQLVWGSNVSSLYSPDPYTWGYCCVPFISATGNPNEYISSPGDWADPGLITSYNYEFQSSPTGVNSWTTIQSGASNTIIVSPLLVSYLRVIVSVTTIDCPTSTTSTSYPLQII